MDRTFRAIRCSYHSRCEAARRHNDGNGPEYSAILPCSDHPASPSSRLKEKPPQRTSAESCRRPNKTGEESVKYTRSTRKPLRPTILHVATESIPDSLDH